MNVMAFIMAAIGGAIIFGGFYAARRIKSKIASGIARVTALFAGLFACALLPMAFSLPVETSAKAGEYLFYILVAGVVVAILFGKKKDSKEAV